MKWLQESEKATIEEDKAKRRWLQPFLRLKYLDSIDRELVSEIARIKAEQSSPATANRYFVLIRTVLVGSECAMNVLRNYSQAAIFIVGRPGFEPGTKGL